jgi:hypothetical protein
MESLCRYTARLLSGARKISANDYAARELTQDATHDTLAGRSIWDPAHRSLEYHLRIVIKRQIAANWERAERLPHVSIDGGSPDEQSRVHDEMEHALRAQRPDPRDAEHAMSAVGELRVRATHDADVVALINARANDRTSRADVMAVTGFTPQRYRAARRRLNSMTHELGIEQHRRKRGQQRTRKTRS